MASKPLGSSVVEWLDKALDMSKFHLAEEDLRAMALEDGEEDGVHAHGHSSQDLSAERDGPEERGGAASTSSPSGLKKPTHQNATERMFAVAGMGPTFSVPEGILQTRTIVLVDPMKVEPFFRKDHKYIPREGKVEDATEEERLALKGKYDEAVQVVARSSRVDVPSAKFLDREVTRNGKPRLKFLEGACRFCAMRDMKFPAVPLLVPHEQVQVFENLFHTDSAARPVIKIRNSLEESCLIENQMPWRAGRRFKIDLPPYLLKRQGRLHTKRLVDQEDRKMTSHEQFLLKKRAEEEKVFFHPVPAESEEVLKLLRFTLPHDYKERGWVVIFADTLKLEKSFRLDLKRYIGRFGEGSKRKRSLAEYQEVWDRFRQKKNSIKEKARENLSLETSSERKISVQAPFARLDGPYPKEWADYACLDLPPLQDGLNGDAGEDVEDPRFSKHVDRDPFLFEGVEDSEWVEDMRVLQEHCKIWMQGGEVDPRDEVLFVRFMNGSHLFAVLRDMKITCLPLVVPEEQFEDFQRLCAIDPSSIRPPSPDIRSPEKSLFPFRRKIRGPGSLINSTKKAKTNPFFL